MEVTRELLLRGHQVTIVTEEHGSQKSLSDRSTGLPSGVEVLKIPVRQGERQKKFVIWKWLWQHRKLIERSDIVHCHDVFFWYLPFRFHYPVKKVFTTFHGHETVFPPSKKAIRIRKLSERLSRGNICVGDFIKKWYGTKPTYVTYGGTSRQLASDSEVSLSDHKLKILFLGRVERDNGVEQYASLLDLLQINKVAFDFTVLGDGSQKYLFEKFGTVKGFQKDTTDSLHDSDIVFASSYLSMLQALAEKKLVVALYSNDLKKDYLLRSPFAPFIIAEKSPDEAYKKIKYFILNPNRLQKMIQEGNAWALSQTWEAVTDLYVKLWKR